MIFVVIMLVIVGTIFACCVFSANKSVSYVSGNLFAGTIFSLIILVILGAMLIFCPIEAHEFENEVKQMRNSPKNFSIQDASSVNEKLVKINYWQNTIFTFHSGFDTTLLDLNEFVSI